MTALTIAFLWIGTWEALHGMGMVPSIQEWPIALRLLIVITVGLAVVKDIKAVTESR